MTETEQTETSSQSKGVLVTPKTIWLPVGLVCTIILAAAGGAVWMNATLLEIKFSIQTSNVETAAQVKTLSIRFDQMDAKIEALANGGQVRADMQNWIKLFEAKNPQTPVPDFPER